uniref:Uncharacterized protein n=1 Tax=Arion vulgaris TaxID=1028688 RepID=A0A0B7AP57_9EUPU
MRVISMWYELMERTRHILVNQEIQERWWLDKTHFEKIREEYNKKGSFLELAVKAKERAA